MTPNHRFKHHRRHTPKHGTQHATKSQCNQKNKKYIGTLSSSQTTTAHPTTNPNQSQRQAAETKLHTRKHKVKSNQTSQTQNRPQAATLFTLIIPSKRPGRSSATRDNLTTNQHTPQNTVAHSKRRRLTLTKHSQQRKHAPHHRTYFIMSANGSFPNRHLTNQLFIESVWRGVVGLADSHKVTHTPTTTQIASPDNIFTTSYQGSFGRH